MAAMAGAVHVETMMMDANVLDPALRPVAVGRGEGESRGRGIGANADCRIHIDKLTSEGFPAENVLDGDVDSYVWPAASRRDVMEVAVYTFTFDSPRRVNRVRFLQHRIAFAYAYRILGSKDGEKFDEVLVDRSIPDPTIPAGEWIVHDVAETTVKAVRLQPLGGVTSYPLYKDLCAPPALAGFEVAFESDPQTPGPIPEDSAPIDVGRALDVNGHGSIRNEMFALSNVSADREFAEKYLKPLNLGMVTLWPSTLTKVPADAEGRFDASYFAPGGGYERDGAWEAGVCAIAKDVLNCPVSLRLEKAPPSMRLTGFASTNPHRDRTTGEVESQFNPPADNAAWARMASLAVQSLNRRHPGAVRHVEMWNEPNTMRYWPMPAAEKASSYRTFFAEAAPSLKAACPGVEVDGPVTSGGVLGWAGIPKAHDLTFAPHWEQWVKGMVDDAGASLDRFNVHPYGHDSACHRAEARLLANYTTLKLGRVVPLSSSEANAATVFGRPGIDFATFAWRKNVVEWADFILPQLKEPDKFAALTYFYITTGNPHDPWGMFNGMSEEAETDASFSAHDPKMFAGKPGRPKGPQPIYYFYRLVRNLRGTLIPVDAPDAARWNVVAARQGRRVNVVVQNRTAHPARLRLPLELPAGVKAESAQLEALEYDPGQPMPTAREKPFQFAEGRGVEIDAAPFGLYSVLVELDRDDFPVRETRIRTYYGDRVWQTLPEGPSACEIGIELDEGAGGGKALLRFGVAGIPYQRPCRILKRGVPLELVLNGESLGTVDGGMFNTIALDRVVPGRLNSLVVKRLAEPGRQPRRVDGDVYLMSAEIEIECEL
jgi:hypothetical protein